MVSHQSVGRWTQFIEFALMFGGGLIFFALCAWLLWVAWQGGL